MIRPLNREELFADRSLVGAVFCRAYSRRADEWLQEIYEQRVGEDSRFALVAIGGYGRSTLSPRSDLDLMLIHTNVDLVELADVSQKLWYPIWDEGLKLGHAVRTVKECMELAGTDLNTATTLIGLRHLAGDFDLANRLSRKAEAQWQAGSRRWLPALADGADDRSRQNGAVAFLLEPDLKEGRGGLRDVDAIRWAEAAGMMLLEQEDRELRHAHEVLLAARVELHRVTKRASNRLLLEDQDEVAAALDIDDADAMMREIATAGRAISWIGDDVWNRARRRARRRRLRIKRKPERVAPGVTYADGTIALEAHAEPAEDALLGLRVAAAASQRAARIDRATLDRLATESAPLPEPWPDEARRLFIDLLLGGHRAIPVIEALDHTGSWVRLVPEWAPNRNRPQRNAYHRFTVDRHLCEAMAEAAERVDWVDRPDLLVLGGLLHDIGKGYPGDHSIVGMDLVETIARRMGFPDRDVDLLVAMVQHHLLLPDAATRLDIDDPGTIRMITDQVSSETLVRLLGALTAADSIATGPSAWSSWKAGLVRDLVERLVLALDGTPMESLPKQFPTNEHRALLESGEQTVMASGHTLTVLVGDVRGVFSQVSGALAANRLEVIQAAVHAENGFALQSFLVQEALGNEIRWPQVCADVERAVEGKLPIAERIAERIAAYGLSGKSAPSPIVTTYVRCNTTVADQHTVVEVGAPDQVGLLYRITHAISEEGFTIDQARVQSLGDHVVDTFYLRAESGQKITAPDRLDCLREAILASVAQPARQT